MNHWEANRNEHPPACTCKDCENKRLGVEWVKCPICKGSGYIIGRFVPESPCGTHIRCPICFGNGHVRRPQQRIVTEKERFVRSCLKELRKAIGVGDEGQVKSCLTRIREAIDVQEKEQGTTKEIVEEYSGLFGTYKRTPKSQREAEDWVRTTNYSIFVE